MGGALHVKRHALPDAVSGIKSKYSQFDTGPNPSALPDCEKPTHRFIIYFFFTVGYRTFPFNRFVYVCLHISMILTWVERIRCHIQIFQEDSGTSCHVTWSVIMWATRHLRLLPFVDDGYMRIYASIYDNDICKRVSVFRTMVTLQPRALESFQTAAGVEGFFSYVR